MKTAIVILNWNGEEMLRKFLPSVVRNSGDALVMVADNGSTDGSRALVESGFASVLWLGWEHNYGFAEGYNQALRRLDSHLTGQNSPLPDYYVLLNSDVEVPPGWLAPMEAYLDRHPDVAACQPKLLSEQRRTHFEYAGASGGYIDRLGYPFCRGRMFDTVEPDRGQYDTVADILWATGAALFIRREAYWEAGGLDGRFFAHQEEIDLCWRLRSRGHRIVCVPESVAYHVGGGTLPKENPRKTLLNFRNNLLLLYKNLPEKELRSVMRLRLWLDALASLSFLLKGEWGSFRAVWSGRRAFRKMRKDFEADRAANMAKSVCTSVPGIYHGSILADYYLHSRRRWSDLQISEQDT